MGLRMMTKVPNIFILAFFFIISCSSDEKKGASSEKSGTQADTMSVFFTNEGNLQAILFAPKMVRRDEYTWAWNISARFFPNNDTVVKGGLKADSGFVAPGYGDKRVVCLFGNVHLVSPDSIELFSDSLRWNPVSQKIETNSSVKMVHKDETLEGTGLISDPNFKNMRILNVKGKFKSIEK